jgi:Peptidase S46
MPRRPLSLLVVLALAACARLPPETPQGPPAPTPAPVTPVLTSSTGSGGGEKATFESPGGMWLPSQLAKQGDTLRQLGLALDVSALTDPMAYPLGAVVSLGGCSASFVSNDGLIVTNHHCATGALQYSSTPDHNLMKDGYLAKTRADEKSAGPTARVYVTQAFRDVTAEITAGLAEIKDDKLRHDTVERRQKELTKQCEAKPNVRCDLASYFGDGQYLLIEKLEIKDVRLVYAPREGIGNFGGEIDNWRWPRHGGDFSFLRAYVGKDGKPAEYAKDNVPYRPRMHLRIATDALAPGDLVFVAGYPGRTYRLETAEETSEAVDWYYPKRIALFDDYLALIEKLGKGDPDLALKARPLERGLANALTYTKGSLEGLTKGGVASARKKREDALAAFIAADAARKQRFGDVLPRLGAIFTEHKKHRDQDFALWELLRLSDLVHAGVTIVRLAEERPKPDAERKPDYQERNWERLKQEQQALEKRYSPKLDAAITALALERAAKLDDAVAKKAILTPFLGKGAPTPESIEAAVKKLYADTKLGDTRARVALLDKATSAELRASRDPMIRVALALRPLIKDQEDRSDVESGKLLLVRPRYVAALREQSPDPIAPDANSTLRVTYGTVRGYRPTPTAPEYFPFTKLPEVAKKATGKFPFDAPARLVELSKKNQSGPYADPALGSVPVDFLTDCDITGGNSGSPTLNAKGELVGLAFDGNYEAMASDWLFMPDITRAIHVDFRYVEWVADAVDHADSVLKELGITPSMH